MHCIVARRGTPSECLLLAGGFSAGRSDLRLLSGDAFSVCNCNYLSFCWGGVLEFCSLAPSPPVLPNFRIRQQYYTASLQLALSQSDKRLCTIFFSGGNSCVPSVASEQSSNVKFPNYVQPNSEIRLNIVGFDSSNYGACGKFGFTLSQPFCSRFQNIVRNRLHP